MRAFLRQRWALWLAALLAAWACASSARMASAQELELPVPRAVIYPGDVVSDELLAARAFIAHTVARSTIYEAREALIGKVARRTLLQRQHPVGRAMMRPILLAALGCLLGWQAQAATRIKDIISVQGVRANQLVG